MDRLDDNDEFARMADRSSFEAWFDKILRKFGFHVCRIDARACGRCNL
jgi:hypothetical protein